MAYWTDIGLISLGLTVCLCVRATHCISRQGPFLKCLSLLYLGKLVILFLIIIVAYEWVSLPVVILLILLTALG